MGAISSYGTAIGLYWLNSGKDSGLMRKGGDFTQIALGESVIRTYTEQMCALEIMEELA